MSECYSIEFRPIDKGQVNKEFGEKFKDIVLEDYSEDSAIEFFNEHVQDLKDADLGGAIAELWSLESYTNPISVDVGVGVMVHYEHLLEPLDLIKTIQI